MPTHQAERAEATMRRDTEPEAALVYAVMEVAAQLERLAAPPPVETAERANPPRPPDDRGGDR